MLSTCVGGRVTAGRHQPDGRVGQVQAGQRVAPELRLVRHLLSKRKGRREKHPVTGQLVVAGDGRGAARHRHHKHGGPLRVGPLPDLGGSSQARQSGFHCTGPDPAPSKARNGLGGCEMGPTDGQQQPHQEPAHGYLTTWLVNPSSFFCMFCTVLMKSCPSPYL